MKNNPSTYIIEEVLDSLKKIVTVGKKFQIIEILIFTNIKRFKFFTNIKQKLKSFCLLLSEHIPCKKSIVIVKKFDFEIFTYLYVFSSPEFIYAIFTVMYVCAYVCMYMSEHDSV